MSLPLADLTIQTALALLMGGSVGGAIYAKLGKDILDEIMDVLKMMGLGGLLIWLVLVIFTTILTGNIAIVLTLENILLQLAPAYAAMVAVIVFAIGMERM